MPEATQEASDAAASPTSAASETPVPERGRGDAPVRLRCQARGIKKSFGATSILKGVDLEIPEGSFAVLVGPSGCGKSTLLRLVAGLEEADEGTIRIADRDVTQLAPRDRDIAMVFQSYALYPHLSVRDNLEFGLQLRKTPRAEIDKRVEEASKLLGLDALLGRLPKQLSGGQRQRVAMGRAIVRRPTLFLFDEPLSNLDAALRAEVRVEIRRLHDRLEATTLYVTHDQVEAMTLADTLWVLNGGLVEQKGPPLEVYERPRTKFVATFLGSPKMTMLEGVLVRESGRFLAEGGGVRAVVDEERFGSSLEEGRQVTIGIRPHDLGLAKNGATTVAELKVELVEALGSEAFAHGWLRASGPSVVARLDADDARAVRSGSAIPLAIAPARVHLFDPKSGLALGA
ncbi:MAG TPA: sn-glycerol-3-phosphate ABC transporter ATP-binding protein UgpC [Labilithrix sp.]|nr:sn-glycerol-3-phosphate ABC transporter ATP-binding protein UgpC [Labilithrix sp.]